MSEDSSPPDRRFRVVRDSSNHSGPSHYRLHDPQGQPVPPVNEFLDATAARRFSEQTLRTYHYNAENQLVSSQLRSPLTWYPSARSCLSRFLRALR